MSTAASDRLYAAASGLREIRRLADDGREAFDASTDRQRAWAYMWVTVGSAVKDYASEVGIATGESPSPLSSATGTVWRIKHSTGSMWKSSGRPASTAPGRCCNWSRGF